MKKRLCIVLSLLLAAVLLAGCGMPAPLLASPLHKTREDYAALELRPFDEMPYERPDVEAMRAKVDEIEAALDAGVRFRKLTKLLDEFYALYYSADTMYTLADIRNCQDLSNPYYAEEYAFCAAASYEINQLLEELLLACGASDRAQRLERSYFGDGFLASYGPESDAVISDEYLALATQESELLSEYRSLTVDPSVVIGGKEVDLNAYLYEADEEESYEALIAYYDKYNPLLGELYLELVKLRQEEAKLLGYGSYAEMQYELGFERDFSIAEGEAFLKSVKQYLVPLAVKLDESALRYELQDYAVEEEDLYDVLEAAAVSLGEDTEEAYRFMRRYGLSDLRQSADKPDMSFEMYLSDYEAPFLFASPGGDMSDILTVTHEFGHYVDSYLSYDQYRSIDLAECFSQAMQYLALGGLRESYSDEIVDTLRLMNLIDSLDTYVQQASFAEFEKRVYAMEAPTVEDLNALSLELAKDYGYYDGVSDEYYAMSWTDTPHFFEQPFYVISYPASAGVALEIYESELARSGAGMEQFLALLDTEDPGLIGAVKEAGLKDPLSGARVREIAAFLEAQLEL